MELNEIKIGNFKSFGNESITYNLHSGLNVIVGENNSGKSNIFKSIEKFKNSLEKPIEITIQERFEENSNNKISLSLLATYHNDDIDFLANSMRIVKTNYDDFTKHFGSELYLNLDERTNFNHCFIQSGEFRFHDDKGCIIEKHNLLGGFTPTQIHKVNEIARNEEISFYDALKRILSENESNSKTSDMCLQIPDFKKYIKNILDKKIIEFPEIRRRPVKSDANPSIATTGEALPNFLFNLDKSDDRNDRISFGKIQKAFNEIFPQFRLELTKGPKIIIEKSNNYDAHQDSFGFGIIEMINFLTHLIYFGDKGNYVFLIEEPENHLHPHARRIISDLINDYSEKNQIIIITHSPDFVDLSKIHSITRVTLDTSTHLHQIPSDYFENDEIEKLKRIRTSEGKDFLFSKAVLLVEGDTELGALPTISKNVKDWNFDRNGISLIAVGGNQFKTFMKLLMGFRIPFLVMCDDDVVMDISGHIDFHSDVNTSSMMVQLEQIHHLPDSLKQTIKDIETKTTTRINRKGNEVKCYQQECFKTLKTICMKYHVYPLDNDFEGVCIEKGYENLLNESKRLFGKSKVLAGIYLADNMDEPPYDETKIPSQFLDVIKSIQSISKMSFDEFTNSDNNN